MNLGIHFKLTDAYRAKSEQAGRILTVMEMVPDLQRARRADGMYGFRCTGVFARPPTSSPTRAAPRALPQARWAPPDTPTNNPPAAQPEPQRPQSPRQTGVREHSRPPLQPRLDIRARDGATVPSPPMTIYLASVIATVLHLKRVCARCKREQVVALASARSPVVPLLPAPHRALDRIESPLKIDLGHAPHGRGAAPLPAGSLRFCDSSVARGRGTTLALRFCRSLKLLCVLPIWSLQNRPRNWTPPPRSVG